MRTVRVAFAGLSPLCEGIFRAALARRATVAFVSPWSRLPSFGADADPEARDVLVIELEGRSLPRSLHALLGATPRLCIVGMSADAHTACIFSLRESHTLCFDSSAEQICQVLDAEMRGDGLRAD